MKFSFLMCVDKHNPFLEKAINSVLCQSDPEFDFYIIANNCSDALWDSLKEYDDKRLILHRTSIGQLAFNLNYGLNEIKSGYVLRMDADDVCLIHRLAKTKESLALFEWPDVLGGQAILINDIGNEFGRSDMPLSNSSIRAALWHKNPMIHPSCALRVESVLGLRGYLGGFMSEDYDLWLRASRVKQFIFCNINEPLVKYRISDGQARGHKLGYSEVAGYMLREGLLGNGIKFYFAAILGSLKLFFKGKK